MNSPPRKSPRSSVALGSLARALAAYRLLAFATGVVLAAGTGGLVHEALDTYNRQISWLGPLWIVHGYLFMAYVLVTLNLAVHRRWHPVRAVLMMAAGTVPAASFIAERSAVHQIRRDARTPESTEPEARTP